MSYKGELLEEDRLFDLYFMLLSYVPDSERADLAQHVYDWLRGWDAPASVFDGMADQDLHLATLGKEAGTAFRDEEYEEDDSDDVDFDYDN